MCWSPWGHKESDMTEWLNCFLWRQNNMKLKTTGHEISSDGIQALPWEISLLIMVTMVISEMEACYPERHENHAPESLWLSSADTVCLIFLCLFILFRLLCLEWPFCILEVYGSSLLWRFLPVGGIGRVACQGFLVREACVVVPVGGAGFLLSGVQ